MVKLSANGSAGHGPMTLITRLPLAMGDAQISGNGVKSELAPLTLPIPNWRSTEIYAAIP